MHVSCVYILAQVQFCRRKARDQFLSLLSFYLTGVIDTINIYELFKNQSHALQLALLALACLGYKQKPTLQLALALACLGLGQEALVRYGSPMHQNGSLPCHNLEWVQSILLALLTLAE